MVGFIFLTVSATITLASFISLADCSTVQLRPCGQLLVSRVTGQWDLGRFHLDGKRVYQDLAGTHPRAVRWTAKTPEGAMGTCR